jgi:hypothetical protein
MSKIKVNETEITIIKKDNEDYISLTDMIRNTDGDQLIKNWIKNKNTIEFLGIWERLHNQNFNMVEFHHIRLEAGTNRFMMSVFQWVDKTGAIGILSKSGRSGGTYAHKDIALEFATWISPEFKLLVIKEFERLKETEAKLLNPEWDYRRFLSKVNYRIQTDAVKENIIPVYKHLSKEQEGYVYAHEAELLNVAVFGVTSKQWREAHQDSVLGGLNIRDLATIPQLTVLANLESYNSILIKDGLAPAVRLEKLKDSAVMQLRSLSQYDYSYPLESPHKLKIEQQKKNLSPFDKDLKGLLNVPPEKKQ